MYDLSSSSSGSSKAKGKVEEAIPKKKFVSYQTFCDKVFGIQLPPSVANIAK